MNRKTVQARLLDEKRAVLAQIRASEYDLFAEDSVERSLAVQMQNRLSRIERALLRLENGQYGFCAACQLPINVDRLGSIPEAELCLSCQSQLERKHNELQLYLSY